MVIQHIIKNSKNKRNDRFHVKISLDEYFLSNFNINIKYYKNEIKL